MSSIYSQLIINGLVSGSSIMVLAIALGICYRISGFFNFALGIIFTLSSYLAFYFNSSIGLPVYLSLILGVAGSTILGWFIECFVFRVLRRKQASSMVFLIASLGLYIFIQNIISLYFGDDARTLREGMIAEGFNLYGGRITLFQIVIIFASLLVVSLAWLFLKKTRYGKAMRAVANDTELAEISGVESEFVILWTSIIGSGLAAIAGILVAFDIDITPTMGMNALMMSVVAVIIGGIGSIPGMALGALLIGMSQNLGVWKISSQWQDAIVFVILLLFLFLKPEGFFGKKVKKMTV